MSVHDASWRRVLDVQMGQWRWTRSDSGMDFMYARYKQEAAALQESSRELIAKMFSAEENKLLDASPIFVSKEMCDLVAAAADPELVPPFEPEPLYVTDLPCDTGFLWYDKPFLVPDRFQEPVTIRAVSWSPILSLPEDDLRDGGEGTTRYTNSAVAEAIKQWHDPTKDWQGGSGVALTLYDEWDDEGKEVWAARGQQPPPVAPMHLTPWWFGMSFDGNEVDENEVPTGALWWWRIVQVTFRLMQQQLAAKHHWRSGRHQRREARRIEFPERETLVVRLRREKKEHEEGESEPANYSHRFIVSGHWRNQWFPKAKEHRQIWISPYVKGDESLPLVIKPRRALVWTK